jgi:catechol 2,3-dioxygenase-like lactoylglutathione lyase family enzyme
MLISSTPSFKALDVTHVRFRVNDLEKAATFLGDFGFGVHKDTTSAGIPCIYGVGSGSEPFSYVAEQGENGFIGFGFKMQARDQFEALAKTQQSEIIDFAAPGGGHCFILTDPNGYQIEVIWRDSPAVTEANSGISRTEDYNMNASFSRINEVVRVEKGPCPVRRLGHVVLHVQELAASENWYHENFDLIPSDRIYREHQDDILGLFMRCNLGSTPTDHHSLFLIGDGTTGHNHSAFEVNDWDDVMRGHDYLEKQGYTPHWGIGKHYLGSQVFDYWVDPFGFVVEHFTDSDKFDASHPPGLEPVDVLLGVQWGPNPPQRK